MPAAPLTPDSAIAVATAGPKSVAASLVPATGGRTVDEELVIIEDSWKTRTMGWKTRTRRKSTASPQAAFVSPSPRYQNMYHYPVY
jgi:hypothetical protein